ncbi:NAD(P)/FAD-dependent oxidoreductase [Rhodococcus sp. AD45-ID]|uniref:flavin-containing monooxygenase n=1 Tax=unclassified Rhodococcus (in: high G+C Gram-positive bacteria) TaxID=192944 RepID=UPI0005D3B213|nr:MULTISPECIES: NAD(P)/FAD-dependent oxidoreductase [unclassified Rhodococcus (in: high G+C Gram-positive bacteria)]KJF23419.1 Phenylacetone monooxygenase [Rhodococcus sp. AD45]PSR41863.1 NAD(P)/FAD-dependent oxidoreductase [Rhodococcus sp. AD45-ID]
MTDPDISTAPLDVVVIGAGVAGLYAMYRLRKQGLRVHGFEAGSGVGGTWYFNRYPGARCDVESFDYSFSFSEELQQDWDWSEKYAAQPEILEYLDHVADRFDLRSGFTFDTRVKSAHFEEESALWRVQTTTGHDVTSRFVVCATGSLSTANMPNIDGRDSFAGDVFHTGFWPHEGVDFTGKRVGVIGTGSSGIQSVPLIAEQADHLYVFQRSANYSVPAGNTPLDDARRAEIKASYAERRALSKRSGGGSPFISDSRSALEVPEDERTAAYEERWRLGGVLFGKTFADQTSNLEANDTAREFAETKIRSVVEDQSIADLLIPNDHPIGTKRIVTDTNYYQTYNRDNVTLVNLKKAPIEAIDATGIKTTESHYDLDALVFATGFDAMTGALDRIDIRGRGGETLRENWHAGPRTYLGLGVNGFPNLFVVTGPGSPSVLSNMILAAEQHVDWIADAIAHLDANNLTTIEPSVEAVDGWLEECSRRASATLFPSANSWYMGANIPGKTRIFMPFIGGFGVYSDICADVAAQGYRGFELNSAVHA